MKEPTFTDIHILQRQEQEYWLKFQLMQPWRAKPRDSGYGGGSVDSTFCHIQTDREDDRTKTVSIADTVRGDWAYHIVKLHNEWLKQQKQKDVT